MNLLKESCFQKEKYMRIATEVAKQIYFYAQWAGHFTCKKDFHIKRSHMPSFLLIYTIQGSGKLSYKGKNYQIEKNQLCFIDCLDLHEYSPVEAPWEFKFIHFYGNLSPEYYDHIVQLYGSAVFHSDVADMEHMIDRVIRNIKNADEESLCSELIYKILISLINNDHQTSDLVSFQNIMNYMAENYMDAIDVSDMARLCNLSRSYFTTKFKEVCGLSPYAYLKQCRISAAKELLINTNHSIQTISDRCGFSSCSAFIRSFKDETGQSPLFYKKSFNKGSAKV